MVKKKVESGDCVKGCKRQTVGLDLFLVKKMPCTEVVELVVAVYSSKIMELQKRVCNGRVICYVSFKTSSKFLSYVTTTHSNNGYSHIKNIFEFIVV